MTLTIRRAEAADAALVLDLIKGIAAYEKLSHEVTASENDIRRSLFGEHPAAEVLLGEIDGQAAGFALFFQNFSTFVGRAGLYLEDLFVLPEYRGKGLGKALFDRVAQLAVERNAGRMEWVVLNWNEAAQRFYKSYGATPMDDWSLWRLTGDALQKAGTGEQCLSPKGAS